MPRYNLSHYGWVVILILVLSILLTLASPFGDYMYNTGMYMTDTFLGITYDALKLDRPVYGGEQCFYADKYGTLQIKPAYRETFIPRIFHEMAKKNNITVQNACKMYEYAAFTGKNVEIEDWLEMGISDKELEKIIGKCFADDLGLKDDIDNALIQYPHMKTREQVMLNYLYLEFVQKFYSAVPGGLSYDGHNVTMSELNNLASKIATALHDDALVSIKENFPDTDDIDTLIDKQLFDLVVSGLEEPQNLNRKLIREMTIEFGNSQLALNIYENLLVAILKSPEKATANDLLILLSETYAIHGIDMMIELAKENPVYDCDRAFVGVPYIGGYTISEIVKYGNKFTLPHRFNIPESYNGITITSIPAKLFDDYNYFNHIETVHLPSTIKSIGERAFVGCDNLEQINLENVSTLGEDCFRLTALTHIELSPELKVIPNGAFEYTPLRYVKINHGTETIESDAFGSCNQLELIYIPNSVININISNSSKLIIYTPTDSPAETYAKNHNIAFINATSVPDYYEVLRK